MKKELERKKQEDENFAKDAWAQLYFIYQNSDHYEPNHNKYPITRYLNDFTTVDLEEVILRH